MKIILSIAVAGALGAVLRYAVVSMVSARFFPWGTLCVNVLGSLLMGVAYVVIVEKALTDPDLKPLLMSGALGAFTTFSAFSLETWDLFERGEVGLAALYVLASVVCSIGALWFGITVTRFGLA